MHARSDIEGNRWRWSKTRRLILARDGHRCQLGIAGICLSIATEVDHIVPRAVGGSDALDNLRSVCHPCHVSRGLETVARRPSRFSYGGPSAVVRRDYTRRPDGRA